MDLGMEGLMIETHRDPDCALEMPSNKSPRPLSRIIRELKITRRYRFSPMQARLPARGTRCLDDATVDVQKGCQGQGYRCHQRARGTEHLPHGTVVKIGPRANFGRRQRQVAGIIHELFALIHKYSVDYQTELIKKDS